MIQEKPSKTVTRKRAASQPTPDPVPAQKTKKQKKQEEQAERAERSKGV